MASTPTCSAAFKLSLAVLLPLLLTEEVWGSVNSYGGGGGPPPDTTDNIQSRIIPPFSPSLELARSMGSSPVTPQGGEGNPLENPGDEASDDRYSSYLGEQQKQLQQLERPDGLDEGVARGVAIPDAAYPRDLISEKGPRWRKDDVRPLGELGLSDEDDEEIDDDDCPPRLIEGFITWRRNNRVVRATLPHMVPSSCTPPLRCSVSTTVHRRVFLQDGDTLEVILQAPPDYTPPTATHPPTSTFTPSPPSPTPLDTATGIYPDESVTDLPTSAPTQNQQRQQKENQQQGELGNEQDRLEQLQQQEEEQEGQIREPQLQQQEEQQNPLQQTNLDQIQEDELISPADHQLQDQHQKSPPQQMATQRPQQEKAQNQQQRKQNSPPEQKIPLFSTVSPPQPPLPHPEGRGLQEPKERQRPSAVPKHVPSAHVNNKTHLFSRDDHHITSAHSTLAPTSTRRKRQVERDFAPPHLAQFRSKPPAILDAVGDMTKKKKTPKGKEEDGMIIPHGEEEDEEEEEKEEEQENQMATSPLTIWRVSVAEWSSCSTREGGQIGETSPGGIVTITPRFLQVGTNYFIGRSSWSSTECFQLQVTVRSAECGEGSLCSGKGTCYANATMEHFQCKCCKDYMGTHCEEMNACVSNPCLNFGICVDIQEGHDGDTFQCLCRYGYRGRYCEERTNLCQSGPCRNGATCKGNHSTYTCRCSMGWSGQQCTEPVKTQELLTHPEDGSDRLVGCAASPCNNGICVETPSQDVRCFCHPGFGGLRCEFEYNECVSSPCDNGATCVDHVGNYKCVCGRGYTGERCQIKYDLCSPNPCDPSRVCVDRGNSHSCECLNGLSEDNCEQHIQVCNPNPCENGGTCWIVPQARMPYCACRPAFTGTTCQGIALETHDEAVPETVGAVGTVEPGPLDVHLPLNHMRNIYVAFATLASALLIFALVVGACHCRVNRTYRKCFVKLPRPGKVLPSVRRPRPTSLFDKSRLSLNDSCKEDRTHDVQRQYYIPEGLQTPESPRSGLSQPGYGCSSRKI